MTFLAVRALSKSYGAMNVLNEISCIVNAGDRIGIVGSNGVGKSTLLKILVGHEEAESGTFSYKIAMVLEGLAISYNNLIYDKRRQYFIKHTT